MTRCAASFTALGALGALLLACEPAGPVASRLQACGLMSEGELGSQLQGRLYAPTECYEACLGSASCDELNELLCGGALTLRRRCDERCAYRCGDGTLFGVERRCDGAMNCADGSDEAGCATWSCDATTLPARVRCDGYLSCADGSDERDCGYATSCDGGRTLYGWERCDGYPHCIDGTDEQDCLELVCDDGQRFTVREPDQGRCDGWALCRDGSDERGCATLSVSCS
jgi:hypothetical protein